jgi:hypothetical protein
MPVAAHKNVASTPAPTLQSPSAFPLDIYISIIKLRFGCYYNHEVKA